MLFALISPTLEYDGALDYSPEFISRDIVQRKKVTYAHDAVVVREWLLFRQQWQDTRLADRRLRQPAGRPRLLTSPAVGSGAPHS